MTRRHCEERSDEAIQEARSGSGLLRFARNDGWGRRIALGAALMLAALILVITQLAGEALSRADLVAPRATEIVYDRNGAFLTQIGRVSREARGEKVIDYGYWPLASIPERLARATLALEDRRFYSHPGVDPRAVLRALWRNVSRGERSEGASTIAMQVARLQHPEPRGYVAKAMEAAAGVALIHRHGRDAVLAHYLQLAPYGAGSHGAAHAARYFFDKPIEDLSWAQVALLAAIPQSPGRMNITRESGLKLAVKRARRALDELQRQGALDSGQAAQARRELAAMRPIEAKRRPEALHIALRYERLAREGRIAPLPLYDPRIHATIDLGLQGDLSKLARRYVDRLRDAGVRQIAVMAAERGSNAVLADIGSADYRDPRAGSFDYTRVTRSPGSTLKPFVYALALERGALRSTDLLNDIPEGASGVSNADRIYLGPMTPRQALANSRNVPATNLLRRVGVEANFDFLHRLGLHDLDAPPESFGLSMAIGSLPTKLENLMSAYAALADDGVLGDLSFAQEQKRRAPRRVVSLDTARLITSFLADPQARLPSFPRYGPLEYPFAVAVKTGTSQGYRDAWTLAYSRKYIVGVWLGRADASAMREMTGAASAAPLAYMILMRLHGAKPGEFLQDAFPPPPGRVAIDMCPSPGFEGACAGAIREWARPGDVEGAAVQSASQSVVDAAPSDGVAMNAAPLVIAAPEHNTHIWRNPEQPAALNALALKLKSSAPGEQIVWHVDGEPFAVAQSGETVFWPMQAGEHRIQARRVLRPGGSRVVRVTVE